MAAAALPFDLEPLVEVVKARGVRKIAVQSPDHLLPLAPRVSSELLRRAGASSYLLVGASPLPLCISYSCSNCRVPVFYAFEQAQYDVSQCAAAFKAQFTDAAARVLVFFDTRYHHSFAALASLLSPSYPNVRFGTIALFVDPAQPLDAAARDKCVHILGRTFEVSPSDLASHTLFWIGGEGQTLTHLLMTHAKLPIFSYEPSAARVRREGEGINKGLMRRLFLVEKAREAQVIGILIATLSTANFTDVAAKLRAMIAAAGKKSYTVVVGKINPAKLANFSEIDVWTVIACTENTLMDSKEFFRPFITPFELAQALSAEETPPDWIGSYTIDFTRLMPALLVPVRPKAQEAKETSLIRADHAAGALTRPTDAAGHFAQRTYQGETEVTKAVHGRKGIAIAYETEGQLPTAP